MKTLKCGINRRYQEKNIWKISPLIKRTKFAGHILYHRGLMKFVIKGNVVGNRCRSSHRLQYIKQVMDNVQSESYEL